MSETTENQDGLPKPKSIYDVFETDSNLENDGVVFDFMFGSFKLAYAGNAAFQAGYADAMKPYAEASARGLIDVAVTRKILASCYAKYIVKDWANVVGRDGQPVKFSVEACVKMFEELPRLFDILRDSASNFANYRKIYVEGAVKN